MSLIAKGEFEFIIGIIVCLAVFVYLVYIIYNDIRKRQFTTTIFIVITDIINLIIFVVVSYTLFNSMYKADGEILPKTNDIQLICLLILFCVSILQSYLKSARFKRN